MVSLIQREEVYSVVGAAMEVYNYLGPGFLEAVYQAALERELSLRGIPFAARQALGVQYKGQPLERKYVADLICFESLVVELKAAKALSRADEAQLLNYLRCTGLRVGLLLNFGEPGKLTWKRRVL